MTNITKFLEYLTKSTYIPCYLYDGNDLITHYPKQEESTFPPASYVNKLKRFENLVTFTITSFHAYYGCVKILNSNSYIVFGPINDLSYTKDILIKMMQEFNTNNSKYEDFSSFFHIIPTQNLTTFLNNLLFVNYVINGIELTMKDVDDSDSYLIDRSIKQTFTEITYREDEDLLNNNYNVEQQLVRFVETGNVKEIEKFVNNVQNVRLGKVATDNLRQWKNILLVVVTLASRASMKGGLSPYIAYELSNIYMQHIERISDIESLQALLRQVLVDYTNRVANYIIPPTADHVLHHIVQYVRNHTTKNITVEDIASHFGYTRPALSKKVKLELGINLSTFIRTCKLEDAKDMLAYSDKSISQISSLFCFSTQSHFQKAFKDEFGITPHNFRKSTRSVQKDI